MGLEISQDQKWARKLINDVLDIVREPISIRYIITDKGPCSMDELDIFAKELETSKAKGDTGFQMGFLKGYYEGRVLVFYNLDFAELVYGAVTIPLNE
ncbi:hypothetical protein JTB14_004554 [Gonioctena quinquepunctata]|nr:hypothetical protein JTB14_004554 [Gonioctena quinquepunctata]